MGNAGGHLPDGGQLTCLHQLILGVAQGLLGMPALANLALEAFVAGTQVGRAFGNPSLQLAVGFLQGLAGCQAGGDDLAPFVPGDAEDCQQGEGHAHQDALYHGFAAQVLQRGQQGEMPGRVDQAPGLGQVGHFAGLALCGFAVGREGQLFHTIGQGFPGQGLQFVQRPPVVLQASRQALLDLRGQRAHRLKAPGRVAGENDDAILVADERLQAGTLPALLEGVQAHFDHRHANDLAVFLQAVGQVIAGLAGGAADTVETPGLAAHGGLEVGTE
ncbi:hypothetical protein D3C76_185020 [compost metagenome]